MFQAVIFDAYGTLISTGTGSRDAAAKILFSCGRTDIDPVAFYDDWKKYHRKHIQSLVYFETEETIFRDDLTQLYHDYQIDSDAAVDVQVMLKTLGRRVAFPEAKECIETLQRVLTVAIGSTTDTEPLLTDLLRNHLSVSHVFTSEGMGVYKPKPLFYDMILEQLGLNAEKVLFVGDSLLDDVWGPQQVGMKACWLNRKGTPSSDGIYPDYEIADLLELTSIILKEKD